MNIFTLYLLFTVLPGLNCALVIFLTCSVVAIICLGIGSSLEYGDDNKGKYYPWIKKFIVAVIVLTIISIFVPGEKQILTIAGGYAVTNDAEVKKLPDNILKAANSYLEKINDANKKQP